MSTNIISFGCSHSLGYYDENDMYHGVPWHEEVVKRCDDVNYFFHVSMPAHGVIDYCYYLTKLDEEGVLKNTNKLIIQHTSEPRCVFYLFRDVHKKFFRKRIMNFFDNDITTPYYCANLKDFLFEYYSKIEISPLNMVGTSIYNHIFNTKNIQFIEDFEKIISAFSSSSTVKQAVRLSYEKIHQIAEKNNIELYEFMWPGFLTDIEGEIHIVDKNIEDYHKFRNFNGHVNKEGHEIIKNNIINYLQDNGFFK